MPDTVNTEFRSGKEPGNKSWPELVKEFCPELSVLHPTARKVVEESMKPKGHPYELAKSFDMSSGGPEFGAQIENLSQVLTSALAKEDSLKLQRFIPKEPTINALYQYNYENTTGNSRAFINFAPGGGPSDVTPQITRKSANIGYAGRAGHIAHQYSVAGAMGGTAFDVRTYYYTKVMMELLKAEERNFIFGNRLLTNSLGQTVNFDGIYQQLNTARPQNIIDLQGADITVQNMQAYAGRIMDEGNLTSLQNMAAFMPYAARTHFAAMTAAAQSNTASPIGARVIWDANSAEIIGGKSLRGVMTADGEELRFVTYKYLYEVGGDSPSSSNRPVNYLTNVAPAVGTDEVAVPAAPAAPTTAATTLATSTLPAGSYWYSVSAGNESGESLATAAAAVQAVTVSPNQQVTVTITGQTGASYYRVYRHKIAAAGEAVNMGVGTCNHWLIATVPAPSVGAGTTYVDTGQVVENTVNIMLLSQDIEDVTVPQLFELQSYIPPSIKTNELFYLLHYHNIVLKNPNRCIFIKNAGVSQSGYFG